MSPHEMALQYLEIKKTRLDLQRQANQLEQEEKSLRDQLLIALGTEPRTYDFSDAEVTILIKPTPVADDWEALTEYIRQKGAVDLLQRRLSPKAIMLRVADGVSIPGIDIQEVPDITIKPVGE